MKTISRFCALLFLLVSAAGPFLAGEATTPGKPKADPVLQMIVSGSTRTFSLVDLEKKLHPVTRSIYNPIYEHRLIYQGFWLDQLLDAQNVKLLDQDIVFLSADGYGTSLTAPEVGRGKWLMAYCEPEGWTPLPGHNPPEFPGPWYAVATDSGTFNEFPWPYQVVTIKIRKNW